MKKKLSQLWGLSLSLIGLSIITYSQFEHFPMIWSCLLIVFYAGYLSMKAAILSKQKEEITPPIITLGLQSGMFILTLALVAIAVIGFEEDKKILLPTILFYFLLYLIYDAITTLKEMRGKAKIKS